MRLRALGNHATRLRKKKNWAGNEMSYRSLPYRSLQWLAGLVLGVTVMAMSANAEDLKSEIAPTGKLRVAIGISAAGGAFWSNKSESGGYAGVPVDLGKEMAAQLGVPM